MAVQCDPAKPCPPFGEALAGPTGALHWEQSWQLACSSPAAPTALFRGLRLTPAAHFGCLTNGFFSSYNS